jgi:hypothetical protein
MQSASTHNKFKHSAPLEATLTHKAARAAESEGASSLSLQWIHEFQWEASA